MTDPLRAAGARTWPRGHSPCALVCTPKRWQCSMSVGVPNRERRTDDALDFSVQTSTRFRRVLHRGWADIRPDAAASFRLARVSHPVMVRRTRLAATHPVAG